MKKKIEESTSIQIDQSFISTNPLCWEIIRLLSENPFITQKEISKKFNLSRNKLIELNTTIRNSEFAQNYIINNGVGSKYWKNTILPTIKNGKAKAALDEKFEYPDRIGICPGLSCNFFCSFCGRNYSASYEKKYGELGMKLYKQIFDNDKISNTVKNRVQKINEFEKNK